MEICGSKGSVSKDLPRMAANGPRLSAPLLAGDSDAGGHCGRSLNNSTSTFIHSADTFSVRGHSQMRRSVNDNDMVSGQPCSDSRE